jgi:hypothetical protein
LLAGVAAVVTLVLLVEAVVVLVVYCLRQVLLLLPEHPLRLQLERAAQVRLVTLVTWEL